MSRVQAIGRAQRKGGSPTDEDTTLVLVPTMDAEDLWAILQAVGNVDSQFQAVLRGISRKYLPGDEASFQLETNLALSRYIDVDSLPMEFVFKSILVGILKYDGGGDILSTHLWDEKFNKVHQFWEENGHCKVIGELACWLSKQRKAHASGGLTEDQQERLEALGVQWIITRGTRAAWEERCNELVAYRQTHGHCDVPRREETGLGQWLAYQRTAYKKGSSKLTEKRLKRLEALGVQWDRREATWEERYNELVAYRQTHNHCNVLRSEETGLGQWLDKQRVAYKKGSSKLTEKRQKRLEALGVQWDPREAVWEERFNELVAYKQKNGHCNVLRREESGPGPWLTTQRQALKKGNLTEERQMRLEALGVQCKLR